MQQPFLVGSGQARPSIVIPVGEGIDAADQEHSHCQCSNQYYTGRNGAVLSISLTGTEARRLRLHSQHLNASAPFGVAGIVRSIAAVQAQDAVAEVLAVRVRTEGTTESEFERARVGERSVVRTWALRGTMHLLPAEDTRWILGLVGPTMVRKAQRRHRELGLTPEVYARAVPVLRRALEEHGALTRRQIAEQWAVDGLPGEGQAVPHLLSRASIGGHHLLWADRERQGDPRPAGLVAGR